jgi:multiple sugar transport system permease protein
MTTPDVILRAPARRPRRRWHVVALHLARELAWYVAMGVVALLILGPVIVVGLDAFKSQAELGQIPPTLFPKHWLFSNFSDLFTYTGFRRMLINSLIVSLGTVALSVSAGSLAAYALARLEFRGRGLALRSVLVTYMFPSVLIVVPLYLEMNSLGLINSLLGLTLAFTSVALPFSTWLLTAFFKGIPREIEEAAATDGCGTLGTFWRIALPLATPAIAATAVATFMLAWGEYLFSITLVDRNQKMTAVAGLNSLIGDVGVNYGLLFAGTVVVLVVPVVLFVTFQRWLIAGMMGGAVKG